MRFVFLVAALYLHDYSMDGVRSSSGRVLKLPLGNPPKNCHGVNLNLLLILGIFLSLCSLGVRADSAVNIEKAKQLFFEAEAIRGHNVHKAFELLQEADKNFPNYAPILMKIIDYGLGVYTGLDEHKPRRVIYTAMAQLFSPEVMPEPISINSEQGMLLASLLLPYHMRMQETEPFLYWFHVINSSSIKESNFADAMLASYIPAYPRTPQDALDAVSRFHERMDNILAMAHVEIPGEGELPFFHNLFYHEVYLEADLRSSVGKTMKLALKAYPNLNHVSPHLLKSGENENRGKIERIKLGIASAFFGKSSVSRDFGETIARLPRDIFEVTYIQVRAFPSGFITPDLMERTRRGDKVITIESRHGHNGWEWLDVGRQKIAALNLDLLLYLDLSMESHIHMLGMSRLARVQATSHGHPVTSGIDKTVMDYYISWGAAELPYDEAKTHYTEELILLPKEHLHQYYLPIVDERGSSKVSNKPINMLNRKKFAELYNVPEEANWYTCMQKSFKRHPEFDTMIAGVLASDPEGVVFLHDQHLPSELNEVLLRTRLKEAGVDLERVFILPVLAHHTLMNLYVLSDVILDSYFAGGCTTTREAIEVGALVVTLPAKYLGGRWSLALFKQIDFLDTVANNKEEYVELAVYYGTNKDAQLRARKQLIKKAKKLFHCKNAVKAWSDTLQRIAKMPDKARSFNTNLKEEREL